MKQETFGQCCNKAHAQLKIANWAPAWAKSYRIVSIKRYRYSVACPWWFRNYFAVTVEWLRTAGGQPIPKISWPEYAAGLRRRPVKRWAE